MKSLYTHERQNIAKTWFLMTVFFGFIISIGYVLSVYMESPAILYGASLFSMASSIGSYWFSDKIALSMSNATLVARSDNKELYNTIDNLAIAAGLPTPKIYIIEDAGLNAFATGRNPAHGVVVFTRGILNTLTKQELQGVAAHELSHIANRDMLVGTIAVILAGAVAIVARMMSFGIGGNRDSKSGPLGIILALVLILIAPLLASLLRMAVSRNREYLADTSGAMLTGMPSHLASALEKIGGHSALKNASPATAHLFIGNPFGEGFTKAKNLFQTHPPIEKRIARLRDADMDASQI